MYSILIPPFISFLISIFLCSAQYRNISYSFSPGISYCSQRFSPNSKSCHYDLKAIEVCKNGKYKKINCGDNDLCDKETISCVHSIDPYRKNNCPHGGLFPLLSDCRKYIYCYKDLMWKCEKGKTFDYKTNECKRDLPCVTFTEKLCNENKNNFLAHPNPKWYVYCFGHVPILGECPGIYIWDQSIKKCRYDCAEDAFVTKNGTYPDIIAENIFYSCKKIDGEWKTETYKCNNGKKFFQSFETCL